MRTLSLSALALILVAAAPLTAQTGPDVIVGQLTGPNSYGVIGNVAAYSVGTTSCNVGDTDLDWFASPNPNHPVIAQNMWRFHNGRFVMIGISWLKHGFATLNGNLCDTCNPTNGTVLGVGCSDPYGAGLNGSQSGLGPRNVINATLGTNPGSPSGGTGNTIYKRLQVDTADLQNGSGEAYDGARYFMEGHYIAADDSAAGNDDNNSSYREISISQNSNYSASYIDSTRREDQGIMAWRECDPNVSIQHHDIPGDGRVTVGMSRTDLGGGNWHLEYCVHNLNSHRSVRSFAVSLPAGAVASSPWFHDVFYHSGEPYSGADWTTSTTVNGFTWSTQTHAQNADANALRWGTAYSFAIDVSMANAPDDLGRNVAIELFRPPANEWHPITICPPQPVIPPATGAYTLDANAAYDFVNIGGGQPGPTGDDSGLTVNLGFNFQYYGNVYTQMTISTNGYLTVPGGTGGDYSNTAIPSGNNPTGVIAGYWDDLNPSQNGSGPVRYDTIGTAPNRRFVAWWDGVEHYGSNNTENHQVILDESGTITVTHVATSEGGSSATVGIQNPGDSNDGIQVSYNQGGSVSAGTSVMFTPSSVTIPQSASLAASGDGSAFSTADIELLSTPNSPFILLANVNPTPTPVGVYGEIPIAVVGAFPVCDALGVFGAPNPACVTDGCGLWTASFPVGPNGVPSTPPLFHFAAVVIDGGAPNGFFHISNPDHWPKP